MSCVCLPVYRTSVGTCLYEWSGPTWMLQETMSAVRKRNSPDIPYSCWWCWRRGDCRMEGGVGGISPHKGAYLHSPHSLNDTETHNPSKFIGNTLTWLWWPYVTRWAKQENAGLHLTRCNYSKFRRKTKRERKIKRAVYRTCAQTDHYFRKVGQALSWFWQSEHAVMEGRCGADW